MDSVLLRLYFGDKIGGFHKRYFFLNSIFKHRTLERAADAPTLLVIDRAHPIKMGTRQRKVTLALFDHLLKTRRQDLIFFNDGMREERIVAAEAATFAQRLFGVCIAHVLCNNLPRFRCGLFVYEYRRSVEHFFDKAQNTTLTFLL